MKNNMANRYFSLKVLWAAVALATIFPLTNSFLLSSKRPIKIVLNAVDKSAYNKVIGVQKTLVRKYDFLFQVNCIYLGSA